MPPVLFNLIIISIILLLYELFMLYVSPQNINFNHNLTYQINLFLKVIIFVRAQNLVNRINQTKYFYFGGWRGQQEVDLNFIDLGTYGKQNTLNGNFKNISHYHSLHHFAQYLSLSLVEKNYFHLIKVAIQLYFKNEVEW